MGPDGGVIGLFDQTKDAPAPITLASLCTEWVNKKQAYTLFKLGFFTKAFFFEGGGGDSSWSAPGGFAVILHPGNNSERKRGCYLHNVFSNYFQKIWPPVGVGTHMKGQYRRPRPTLQGPLFRLSFISFSLLPAVKTPCSFLKFLIFNPKIGKMFNCRSQSPFFAAEFQLFTSKNVAALFKNPLFRPSSALAQIRLHFFSPVMMIGLKWSSVVQWFLNLWKTPRGKVLEKKKSNQSKNWSQW